MTQTGLRSYMEGDKLRALLLGQSEYDSYYNHTPRAIGWDMKIIKCF